jgi:hypothetical protein
MYLIGPKISENKIKMHKFTDNDTEDSDDRCKIMAITHMTVWAS